MKLCAIVSEYNPFHNGHEYLIKKAKEISKADAVLCITSGNFTQRGEMAITDKFTRAKHACLSGADAVIELPTVFASANAEIFSKGAIKILSSIPNVKYLAFGCEDEEKESLIATAKLLNDESENFKAALKRNLDGGLSYAKAKNEAIKEITGSDIYSKPNNILALEYVKAILKNNADIEILPIKRIGNEHNDSEVRNNFTSASSIRENYDSKDENILKAVRSAMPSYVFEDIKDVERNAFKRLAVYSLTVNSADYLKGIADCTEGLENKFKALIKENCSYDRIVEEITCKRYTSSRIKRIMLSSLLKIQASFIRECLKGDLYLKVLALNKDKGKNILSALSESPYPLITRKTDESALLGVAKECFEKDILACEVFSLLTDKKINPYYTLFI